MYLDSKDYQTVWQLAHNWVGANPVESDPSALPAELKEAIHRLMLAALNQAISIRTRKWSFFVDDTFMSFIIDFGHFKKFRKCARYDEFDKAYLDSIYVKRSDVLRWCQNEFLTPPPIWQPAEINSQTPAQDNDAEEDEETGWYENLSGKRKQRVACLEMAKRLWEIKEKQTYGEVFNHPQMLLYCKPSAFSSLRAFKVWAGEFAPEYAKNGGREKESMK
jgi:hypothetical protein